MSHSLRPHESQHARPPCPLPTPGVYSNSCPLSQWCHPVMSSSVVPFSSCPQSLPASGSFPMSLFHLNSSHEVAKVLEFQLLRQSFQCREMQIKTTRRYHHTPVRMAIINQSTNYKCWRGCGEMGTHLHCWWEYKFFSATMENGMEIPLKSRVAIRSNNPTPGHISEENSNS